MNRTFLQRTILLTALSVILCGTGQTQYLSNTTWMRVYEDSVSYRDSLTFGSHIYATYGADSALAEERRPALAKGAAAPGGLEVSFQPIPGRPHNSWYPGLYPKCLYEAVPYAKKDTFVLSVGDGDPRALAATVHFEWPDSATLAAGADSMFLVDHSNRLPRSKVNMMSQPSFTVDSMFSYNVDGMWIYRYTKPILTDEIRESLPLIPKAFALDQNYPNPFNPTTIIRYQLPGVERSGTSLYNVSLKIYNLLGQVVATIVDGVQEAGYREARWDAGRVASGVYFYKLEAVGPGDAKQSFTQVKKMVLLK